MTVSSSTAKVSYSGNSSTVAFAVNFYFLADSHLKVVSRAANGTETVKTLTTDYTVTGAGNPSGGTVTMLTAPATGTTLVIARNVPITQLTDYTANDPFPAETHEQALDKLTMETQQINEAVARSIKLSLSNTMTSTEFTVGAADRANKVFSFDASGELTVAQELGTYKGNWASGTVYAVRDIIKDTSNSNIYICITAHTASGSQPISSNSDVAKWALIVDAAAAATSAAAAASSASAASSSASAASTSASNASTSATNASNSASAASSSASSASTAATNAGNSATAAASSASAASGSASSASTSASNASTSATNASNSATSASGSASTASTQATNASNSASAASTSATNAGNFATSASNSASAASTSATNASNAQTAAEAARDATLTAYDNFDDRYLGSKTSDPTLDNDGNALLAGSLYFNSVSGAMKVYTGSAWVAAYVSGTDYLAKANNLSDLTSTSTARTNLGLVTSATTDTTNASNISSGTLPAARLPASGVTANTYGSSSSIPVITFDTYGRATSVTTSAVAGGQYFGSAATKAIAYNSTSIAENITTTSGNNCLSVGPITIASGFSVTVASGQRWLVL